MSKQEDAKNGANGLELMAFSFFQEKGLHQDFEEMIHVAIKRYPSDSRTLSVCQYF